MRNKIVEFLKNGKKMYNYFSGSIIVLTGLAFILAGPFNIKFFNTIDSMVRYLYGGVCLIYGLFRIYRGTIA